MSAAAAPAQHDADGGVAHKVAVVWLPFALAYFFSSALRNINAVLVPDLTAEFALSASQLGLLTSVFFAAFSMVQLPAGILLDRYGSRRVNASLLLVAAAGCALHTMGSNFQTIALGRVLIGLGMAMGLMSSAKVFAQWFELPRVPLALNLLMAFGGVGTIVAAGPVGWSLNYVPWRMVFSVAAGLLIACAGILYFVVPEKKDSNSPQSLAALAAGFRIIFSDGTFWRMGLMLAMISGTHTAVQSLWIGPWLRDVGGFDRPHALALMTGFSIAAVLGFIGIGALCDRLIGRGIRVLTLYKIHSGLTMLFFALVPLLGEHAAPAWLGYFAMASGGPLVLTLLARHFSPQLAGRASTASNVLIFSLAFVFQWGMGAVLDRWPVIAGHYAEEGYQAAFTVLLMLQLATFLLLALGEKPRTAIGARQDATPAAITQP